VAPHRGVAVTFLPSVQAANPATTNELRALLAQNIAMRGSALADDFTAYFGEPRGKIVRGSLTLAVIEMFTGDFRNGVRAATAIELLHLASMVVDDWVDDAKLRHGRETVVARYGVRPACAIARHLLYRSFAEFSSYHSPNLLLRARSVIDAMIAGQRLEEANARFCTLDSYRDCISGKTAALFGLACEASAIIAGEGTKARRRAREFGCQIGLAFQIVDDYLDFFGSNDFGKRIGMDFISGVYSAPILLFCETSAPHAALVRTFMTSSSRTLAQFYALQNAMIAEGIAEKTLSAARVHSERAKSKLGTFPPGPSRDFLAEIADGIVTRSQ
jgi:geranylgeranyl pyrophosphate synthase